MGMMLAILFMLIARMVVHELCHIRQFNHSKAFWALVAEKIPDYIQRRRQLRAIGLRGRSALQ
jgi:predicted metal-dependent hydrolase